MKDHWNTILDLKSTSLQYGDMENYKTDTRQLAPRLTAKLASYPTLYYVVVTAVRRRKHFGAKLLCVSYGNKKRAMHNTESQK